MTRTRRVLSVVGVVIVVVYFAVATGAVAAPRERVTPRVWVRTYCATVLSAAASMAAEGRTWPVLGPEPQTAEELAAEFATSDRVVSSLARLIRATRAGVQCAGIPAVPGGAAVLARHAIAVRGLLDTASVLREAFAVFLAEHERDPLGAIEHLRTALAPDEARFSSSFQFEDESPCLARAVRSVPVCLEMTRRLADADAAMTRSTRFIRTV